MKFPFFNKRTPHYIQQIVYIDQNLDIVVEFENAELRVFSVHDHFGLCTPESYDYYFRISESVVFSREKITWNDERVVTSSFLYKKSKPINILSLEDRWMYLGYKNQAPTNRDPMHDVYYVLLFPFKVENSFALCESIHGGHGDTGGALYFSLKDLLRHPNWKEHFELSDCQWAIEIIENEPDNFQVLTDQLKRTAWKQQGYVIQAPLCQFPLKTEL